MSYIHKALRKAQREKDSRQTGYQGVLSAQSRKGLFTGRPVLLGSLVSISVLLVLALYSWFSPKNTKITEEQVVKHEEQAPDTVRKMYEAPVMEKVPVKAAAQEKNLFPPVPERHATANVVNVKQLYEKGRIFQNNGRLSDAKRLYQEALKADPLYVDALNNLGVIYLHEKNYQAAQTSFERAFRLNPGNVDPCYNLACVHALKGETERGLSHLQKACSLNKAAKNWARKDADLENLRTSPEFAEIVKD